MIPFTIPWRRHGWLAAGTVKSIRDEMLCLKALPWYHCQRAEGWRYDVEGRDTVVEAGPSDGVLLKGEDTMSKGVGMISGGGAW